MSEKKDMSIRYFIAIKSCTRLWCLLFHIICRDYTDYAFYLPGGAGIRTVTAIMTKRPWNPPNQNLWNASCPMRSKWISGGPLILRHLYLSKRRLKFITISSLDCLTWQVHWCQLYISTVFAVIVGGCTVYKYSRTIVNVANKLAHLRRCKDFLRLGIPLIFRISNLWVSHLPLSHPMAVLQGHFWFWMLCLFRCKNQKASLDLRWLSNQLHRVRTTNFMGFLRKSIPDSGCVIEFHEKHVFQLYPKNNCCH